MLTRGRNFVAGFSLIELMIGLVVLGIVLMIGLPSLAAWMQNTQIRNSAETINAGLQLARAEALRRNTNVRFQLVDSLAAGCALSSNGRSWVVSLADAVGQCDATPSETAGPMILQKKDGTEGSPNAAVDAAGQSSVIFTGLGRVNTLSPAITSIDITNPNGGACVAAGPMRCLRVTVAPGGQVRLCDPAVGDATDPRAC
jgi:type IV fimbrial biogenesis protein FimT